VKNFILVSSFSIERRPPLRVGASEMSVKDASRLFSVSAFCSREWTDNLRVFTIVGFIFISPIICYTDFRDYQSV